MTEESFMIRSKGPAEVRLLSSYRNGEISILFSLIITFGRDDSQVLEKVVLGL